MNLVLRIIGLITQLPRRPLLLLIRLYQKTLSPDHGLLRSYNPDGYCRYYPTCSSYSYQAIESYGIIVGGILSAWRVLRCNPWSHGGSDRPPQFSKIITYLP